MRLSISPITSLLAALLLALPCAAAKKPVILIVNSYHAGHPWVADHNGALKRELSGVATLHFHDMDTKRLKPELHPEQAVLALEKYRSLHPDIVVLTDDNALSYLGRDIAQAGTPVVYLGINANPRSYVGDARLVTGVLERPLLKRSMVFLHDILGKPLNKCLVMFDNSATSKTIFHSSFGRRGSVSIGRTQTDIVMVNTFEEWRHHILSARGNNYDAIILGLYQTLTDNTGNHVAAEPVVRWTSANTPVPIFCFWDFTVGRDKAVGGLVLAGRPQGEAAAKLIRRILNGEHPRDVQPVTAGHGRFLFSRSQLKRWDINLPATLAQPRESLEFVD